MKKQAMSIFIICSLLLCGHAFAAEYCTINEIREQTADGWHETYVVDGREVIVDVAIDIPDVASVPAILVQYPENVSPDTFPANADLTTYWDGFSISVETTPHALSSVQGGTCERNLAKDAQAEYCELTSQDAASIVLSLLAPYTEPYGIELNVAYVDAWTRTYANKNGGEIVYYDRPLTTMGHYCVILQQSFHGIPYVRSSPSYQTVPPKTHAKACVPRGEISGIIASAEDYAISFCPAVEAGALADDLPLVSFTQVKTEFEKLILSGYIRDVYKVRLEYVRMDNPEDRERTAILIPVWELNGYLVDDPNSTEEAVQYSPDKLAWIRAVGGGREALVDAQTGTYFDPMDSNPKRYDAPALLRWEDVR